MVLILTRLRFQPVRRRSWMASFPARAAECVAARVLTPLTRCVPASVGVLVCVVVRRSLGGHPRRGGRFWRPHPGSTAALAYGDTGRLQIGTRRLPADRGGLLDASQRPSQSPQRQYLLLFVVAQDVAHGGERTYVPRRCQRLGCYVWWPVFRCPSMAGFGCPPRTWGTRTRRPPPPRPAR
jgi:hypothetical protein